MPVAQYLELKIPPLARKVFPLSPRRYKSANGT